MKQVGVFEAKTRFSALIEEVRAGATIVVTKNGEPVAQIAPVRPTRSRASEAMRRILSRRGTLGKAAIRELIDEGRRY